MPFQSDCAFAAPGLLRGFVMLEGQPDRHWHVGLYANGRFLGATLADRESDAKGLGIITMAFISA